MGNTHAHTHTDLYRCDANSNVVMRIDSDLIVYRESETVLYISSDVYVTRILDNYLACQW